MPELKTVKVYAWGRTQAGVTSIVNKLWGNKTTSTKPTIAVDLFYPSITQKDGSKIAYQLWDAASDQLLSGLPAMHSSVGVFFVDLQKSLNQDEIQKEIDVFKQCSPNATVILVGTKSEREITPVNFTSSENQLLANERELKKISEHNHLNCVMTSAKHSIGINEFKILLEAAVIQQHELLNPKLVKVSQDASVGDETIGVKLLKLTMDYSESFRSKKERAMKQSEIAHDLIKIINNSQLEYPERIQNFYDYLQMVKTGETKSNMELIKEDNRVSAKNFVLGVLVILAIVATGVVPGLVVIGLMGKNPLHLFESSGQTFFRKQQHFKDQINPSHEDESIPKTIL